jgi:hypothetical protein
MIRLAVTPHPHFFRRLLIPIHRQVAMAKPLLQLAALGVAGFALWKIASFVLLPFLLLVFKVALILGVVMLAIWFFRKNDKNKNDKGDTTPGQSQAL